MRSAAAARNDGRVPVTPRAGKQPPLASNAMQRETAYFIASSYICATWSQLTRWSRNAFR